MKKLKEYDSYQQYVDHQKTKTLDPKRRELWLGEEWDLKLNGFSHIFGHTCKDILKPGMSSLCIGARTGQEVVALKALGLESIGIDLVPCEPHVITGDMHDMDFEDESFDFVFTNVFDHSLYPDKMISEIERVLKPGGHFLMHLQFEQGSDEYAENEIEGVESDIFPLINKMDLVENRAIPKNFAGMNWEMLATKRQEKPMKSQSISPIADLIVPDEYQKIWDDINLPVQVRKGNNHGLSEDYLNQCLGQLSKRGYYLVSIAEQFGAKNIAEVGTAQGWQFYTFAHYARKVGGHVWSCDIVDVHDKNYAREYSDVTQFVPGTSEQLAESIKASGEKIDLFYIDGMHDEGWVLDDVERLKPFQSDDPIWIFDDYDERFGCALDIEKICKRMPDHFIYRVGDAASGQPNHQVAVFGKIV